MAKKLHRLCVEFHATQLYHCPHCGIQLRSFENELREKIDAIPREIKQKLMDELRNGNVGYAISQVDPNKEIDSLVWFTIISDQIGSVSYFDPIVK